MLSPASTSTPALTRFRPFGRDAIGCDPPSRNDVCRVNCRMWDGAGGSYCVVHSSGRNEHGETKCDRKLQPNTLNGGEG